MFIGYPIYTFTSSAVDSLVLNPITAQVEVKFMWGGRYVYEGVSRRAILHLMANQGQSLGKWVNRHCLQRNVAISI